MPKASQQDLAKLLEISQAAVSKALRGDPTISEKVRSRVKDLADKLNYRPNRLARSLIDGRAPIVGLVMPQIFGAVASILLSEIERHLRELGYLPLVVQIHTWDKDNRELIELLLEYKVQGIIVFLLSPSWEQDFFQELIDSGEKIVFFNNSGIPEACCVASDDRKGAAAVVSHLIGLGHRDIAFCWSNTPESAGGLRLAGYRDILRSHDLPEKILDVSQSATETILKKLLKQDSQITAVFCADDNIAVDFEASLFKLKVPVPDQISLVGFGDNFYHPDAMRTPMTTVSHQPRLMAEKAVKLFSDMVAGRKPRGVKLIPCQMICRHSVKDLR